MSSKHDPRKTIHVDKMIKFMDHDADELVQNIDESSEESYEAEKEKLILKGTMEVNQLYNKKTKLVNRQTATMIATKMTNAKLEILRSRDMHIKSVMANVNTELIKMRRDTKHYNKILKKLILQAMYHMLEKEVNIILLSRDIDYVESIVDKLEKKYEKGTGMCVKINIERDLELPVQEIGGVMVTSKNRRLIVENTLVVRLLQVAHLAIPIIRSGLFGPNPTRNYSNIIV